MVYNTVYIIAYIPWYISYSIYHGIYHSIYDMIYTMLYTMVYTMVYTFLMVYTMVCTFIFGIYRDICNFSSLTCFFGYHSQVVILDKLARYRFPPSLRTARHDHKTSHSMIFWIGALGSGKTTIMHCQRAVQAAERVPGRGIRWLNLVTACLDSKLQILMHCSVIFRYQHRVVTR